MRVVVVGAGKVGEYLASTLVESGNEVSIIEIDHRTALKTANKFSEEIMVIEGDGCDSKYQDDAGIRKADIFVATTGQDDNNLVACEIAKRVYGVERCVARVNNPRNMKIFRACKIESVSSTALIANLIQEEALLGSVGAVTSLSQGQVVLEEITIPHMKHRQNEGIPIGRLSMPHDSLIVAVTDGEDAQVASADVPLYSGDTIIVAADRSVLEKVRLHLENL